MRQRQPDAISGGVTHQYRVDEQKKLQTAVVLRGISFLRVATKTHCDAEHASKMRTICEGGH